MKSAKYILMAFFLLAGTLAQEDIHDFYSINYTCPEGFCVEGQPIIWKLDIQNFGGEIKEYTRFEFIDAINQTPIMDYSASYFPLRNDRGNFFIAYPHRKHNYINITSIVARANQKTNTIFYPCFTTTVGDIHVFVRHNDYVFRQCYDDNWTLPSVQCLRSEHCGAKQYCLGSVCRDLNCESCQYISNHSCNNYQCCASTDCRIDQICQENSCLDLNCETHEYLFNRTCKALNCNFDEYIVNNSCAVLECALNEYVFNHTCQPLVCPDQEYIFNHSCRSCAYDHRLENGVCVSFSCRPDQAYVDHNCVELACRFYEKIGKHECVLNARALFKFVIEICVVALIAILVILDIKKRKIFKRKEMEKKIAKAEGKTPGKQSQEIKLKITDIDAKKEERKDSS